MPIKLVAGYNATFMIIDGKVLWGCGHNRYGQLGLGDIREQITFAGIPLPQLDLALNEKIIQVETGGGHTIALTSAGRLLGCGCNFSGQLGLGHTIPQTTFTEIPLDPRALQPNEKITQLAAGYRHTMVLTSAGRLFGCGDNRFGELGLEDTTYRNRLTPIAQLAHPAMKQPWAEEAVVLQEAVVMQAACRAINIDVPFLKLPDEVLRIIFDQMTIESLVKIRRVCARFNTIILVMYSQRMITITPDPVEPRIMFADVMRNARQIYDCLSPAEQLQFKAEFLRCFPENISATPGLARLLPAPVPTCSACGARYDQGDGMPTAMVLRPCGHSVCTRCFDTSASALASICCPTCKRPVSGGLWR